MLAAVITATLYLAANPTPRDSARTFLDTTVIPGLRQIDPFLVGGRIRAETLNCRLAVTSTSQGPRFTSHCENLLSQVIRLPGALVHAARDVIGTGWPGIAIGMLTLIFTASMISGSLDNPFMWPMSLLVGSLAAAVFLWVLQRVLIFVAGALAWILWLIAAGAWLFLTADWVLRGAEVRRVLAGGSHGPAAEAARPGQTGRAGR